MIVLLTKIDQACNYVANDVSVVYRSTVIRDIMALVRTIQLLVDSIIKARIAMTVKNITKIIQLMMSRCSQRRRQPKINGKTKSTKNSRAKSGVFCKEFNQNQPKMIFKDKTAHIAEACLKIVAPRAGFRGSTLFRSKNR